MSNPVEKHYVERVGLVGRIAHALRQAGMDPASMGPEEFSAIDEFHIRGRQATLELAAALKLKAGDHILDVGSGLGGPARTIAAKRGCKVTGIDLTAEFTHAARTISEWTGLEDQLEFHTGDATELPFADDSFDAAVCLHSSMNIENKLKLFGGIARALKPYSSFGIYDVLQGQGGEVLYPVPWARDPENSHLLKPGKLTELLEQSGFAVQAVIDSTRESTDWLQAIADRMKKREPGPLSFRLFLGEAFPEMIENLARNLAEGRVRTVTVIARVTKK